MENCPGLGPVFPSEQVQRTRYKTGRHTVNTDSHLLCYLCYIYVHFIPICVLHIIPLTPTPQPNLHTSLNNIFYHSLLYYIIHTYMTIHLVFNFLALEITSATVSASTVEVLPKIT